MDVCIWALAASILHESALRLTVLTVLRTGSAK
jgi:hypothetical protein